MEEKENKQLLIADLEKRKRNKDGIPYNNRELSWLDFNLRVLEEAMEHENPIMERVNFLSITASNLDEFFMVRVAGVLDQVHQGLKKKDFSGNTPKELFEKLSEKIHNFVRKQYSCLSRSLMPDLKNHNMVFSKIKMLNKKQLEFVDKYFENTVFPILTPMAVDTSRPFPQLMNKSVNIAVRLNGNGKKAKFAIIQVPSSKIIPRFLEVPSDGENRVFVMLEDIIMYRIQEVFELYKIITCSPFRITRDSDLDIDEDAEDLLVEIQNSIKLRKRGKPVRLEITKGIDKELKKFLVHMLDVGDREIYEVSGALDLTFLSQFCKVDNSAELHFSPITPVDPPADFYGYDDVFKAIQEKDRMVHHPYDSFNAVLNFIQKAADDPDVLAIKQTLYRVSGESPVISALIKAVEKGKQVTVLVELKARFDEENNIHWAKKLEDAGCHVIYGLTGLKTHCKICLVVRREQDGIRRYLHVATGNYNDITARFYTDIGMFTCREDFGEDATVLFNVLTGYSLPPVYNKFVIAPRGMRTFFEEKIKQEEENCKKGLPSGITVKINSLVDPNIIKLLYQASEAGVEITLIIRGICCLIPGLEGYSTNITVYSIVGQLLEHSRIFRFENGGNPEIYMGSADWMPRNLDRRVELVFPVEDEDRKKRVEEILKITVNDTINKRTQHSDTTYTLIDKRGKKKINSQVEFSKMSKRALKNAKKYIIAREIGTPRISGDLEKKEHASNE